MKFLFVIAITIFFKLIKLIFFNLEVFILAPLLTFPLAFIYGAEWYVRKGLDINIILIVIFLIIKHCFILKSFDKNKDKRGDYYER